MKVSVGFLQRKGVWEFSIKPSEIHFVNIRIAWPTSSHSEDSCSRCSSKNHIGSAKHTDPWRFFPKFEFKKKTSLLDT